MNAFIALGTNLPWNGLSGPDLLAAALAALEADGLVVEARSSVWLSPAWPPGANQPDYHNAVVKAATGGLAPDALFRRLRGIEAAFGRVRRERWGSRTLDLDILAADGFVGRFDEVDVPHPRLSDRAFVLAPLAEIAPDWRHPILGMGPGALLAALPSTEGLRRVGTLN